MVSIKYSLLTVVITLLLASPAMPLNAGPPATGNPLILIFICFCALLVVIQLIFALGLLIATMRTFLPFKKVVCNKMKKTVSKKLHHLVH